MAPAGPAGKAIARAAPAPHKGGIKVIGQRARGFMGKLSISKAWDESRQVLARDGGLLATVALALIVLPGVVAGMLNPQPAQGQMPELGWPTLVTALSFLLGLVGQIALIRLAIGSRLTVGEAIGHGVRRALPYIAATLLWVAPFLIVIALVVGANYVPGQVSPGGAGLVLLIALVMLVLAIRMLMTAPVASAETSGPIAIIRRSWDLTRGNWWRLFAFFLLFLIAVVIVMLAVGAILGVVSTVVFGDIEPMSVGALLVALVTQVAAAAITVVFIVMLARIYVQLAGEGEVEASVPSSGT